MRLVDADTLAFDYSGLAFIHPHDYKGTAKYFLDQVKSAPTIDPVKRGEWEAPFAGRAICSVCKQDQDVEMFVGNPTQAYCARCGADMRMENKD